MQAPSCACVSERPHGRTPSPNHDTETDPNPNTEQQQSSDQQSSCQEASSQCVAGNGRAKPSTLTDAMLREILRAETLTDDAQTLKILKFKDTHARNLTVGLVLALFRLVTSMASSGDMAAEVILSEIAAFAKPLLNMQNNKRDITKLSRWATKMKSDINKGNLRGHTSLSSLLKSLIFPNLWKQNGSSVPEIADVHIPE